MTNTFSKNNFIYGLFTSTRAKKRFVERQILLPKQLTKILNALKKEPKALIFLQKVTKKEAPNYFDIIKCPMDLNTMTKKIHLYNDMSDFKRDLDLIWDNCLTYNVIGDYYRDCAISMREIADYLCSNKERVYPNAPVHKQSKVTKTTNDIKGEMNKHILSYFNEIGFKSASTDAVGLIVHQYEQFMSKSTKKNSSK